MEQGVMTASHDPITSGGTEKVRIRLILVPVDFSECSKTALRYAVNLGLQLGAKITALHIWEPPSTKVPECSLPVADLPSQVFIDLEQYVIREAREDLNELLLECNQGSLEVHPRLLKGQPTEQILRYARDIRPDLIIMGTHGRSGLAHLFLGSVTEKVLRQAPCPVLAIRRDDRSRLQAGEEAA